MVLLISVAYKILPSQKNHFLLKKIEKMNWKETTPLIHYKYTDDSKYMRSLIFSFSLGYDFVNLIFKVANRTLYNLKKIQIGELFIS